MTGSPILAPWRDHVDDVAPVVLVIGGFMSSPPMYRSLRRLLLERDAPEVVIARLWMPDWMLAVGRGQGAIAARAGRALLDASAASAASEASAGAPVLIVGHSGGGVIARILTSREPFERRRMNASGRIGAIVTLGSPQMFDAKGPSAQRMGATAVWASRHVPGAFAAPRTGYLCVGSDAIVGSSSGDRKARRIDRYYRGVISAPEGASIPGDGITPLAAAFLPGVESIVLHDAGHANVISRHWYGDVDHVDAWWPRAVEVWRDALRARVGAGEAAAASRQRRRGESGVNAPAANRGGRPGARRRAPGDAGQLAGHAGWVGAAQCTEMDHANGQPTLSVADLGGPIGLGRTAEVFARGNDEAVKLLRPGIPEIVGEREASIAALVDGAGVGAPRFGGTTRIDGRLGLVYERLDGPSMLDRLSRNPLEIDRLAREFAELHVAMHDADGSGLPDQKAEMRRMIDRAGDCLPDGARALRSPAWTPSPPDARSATATCTRETFS